MRLPVRTQRAERIEVIDRWVDEFRTVIGGDDLAWVCLPHLIIYLRSRFEGQYETSPVSAHRVEQIWSRERSNPVRETTVADGNLFFAFSENQRLAQAPIAARLGPEGRTPTDFTVSERRESELVAQAVELVEALLATARRQSLELPVKRRLLYRLFLRAVRDLSCWEALIDSVRPQSTTIGSTHSAATRSLTLVCRRAEVPCVYVPHAPMLSEARLADLPVDLAGVRGPAEASYYAEHGADAQRITAIGNPGVNPSAGGPPDAGGGLPVFALPTDDDWALERLVALVHAALGDGVIASPHPRADRAALRGLLPQDWEVWEGRTFELLQQGPPALIQASSGVGLEGLQLGIPTIELAFPGERPNYPYLSDSVVSSVSTAEELRAAVEAAARVSDEERNRIRAGAQAWVCDAGPRAAEAGEALVRRAGAEGTATTPVWDAWRTPPAKRPVGLSAEPSGDGASSLA
jgi:hypothetical protein